MVDQNDPVSVAILSLLSFITIILTGYLSLYCYAHYKAKQAKLSKKTLSSSSSNWLDTERKPLIPGNFHTQTIQPVPTTSGDQDYEDSFDDLDVPACKERDYSELGRIIFVMRYNKKREELMVRLVQIEGMPASQELYCPNSAYVDVGLKYTGDPETKEREKHQKPPRLDICLQQVYYFIISTEQMMNHSLEFRINTFDEQFRRYVCGIVEVKLSEEMGEDIFSGNEVVFVEEILEPFQVLSRNHGEDDDSYDSTISELDEEITKREDIERMRPSSCSSSNMSWEPEVSKELLSTSTNSIWNRCLSMQDLHAGDLSDDKRCHSIGYLPAYEWTVKDIRLDDDPPINPSLKENDTTEIELTSPKIKLPLHLPIPENINPSSTPESFYHIVPVTPLYNAEIAKSDMIDSSGHRRVAYKKYPKRKLLARSLTMKRSALKINKRTDDRMFLERSSSCPSLSLSDKSHKCDESPERKPGDYFF